MLNEINAKELVAKIRDVVIDTTKAGVRDLTGAELKEDAQRALRDRASTVAWGLVDTAVRVVAGANLPAVTLVLEDASLKGAVKLKAADLTDDIGAIAKRKGAEVVLVLASAKDFDARRPPVVIVPDQRSMLPADDADDAGEPGDDQGEEQAAEFDAGSIFSVVEAPTVTGPDGEEVHAWILLHGDAPVFDPVGEESFVDTAAARLTDAAAELGRDLTAFEVRDRVLSVLQGEQHHGLAVVFAEPYTVEAINAAAANPPADSASTTEEPARAKAGRKSAAEIISTYHGGYDAAQAGQSIADCPHAKGKLKDMWQRGWADQKDGKPRAWALPTAEPANDDATTESEAA